MSGRIRSLARAAEHRFSKQPRGSLRLLAGLGVEGDAHCGETVKHRSRVELDPTLPNLRQVHLLQGELLAELADEGFEIAAGDLGENVLTEGIDLLALPTGARLSLGDEAEIEITGLRNPCAQIEAFAKGLLSRVARRDETGRLELRAGVMAIVLQSGAIHEGDAIRVTLPATPHRPLERV